MAVNLGALQRQWFARHLSGVTAQTPLNDLKRRYFVSQIGGASANVQDLNDMEVQWFRKLINDNGGTPSGMYPPDLLKQALAALGFTVTKYDNQNRINLFQNLA
jgi:hypothetical protein